MKLTTKLNLIYLSEFFVFFHLFGGVLIPFFTTWGGLSLTQIMLLQGWFSFCILLFELPTGTIADRLGRKRTITLGLAIWTIGILMYGFLRSFWWYMLAEMFWALSSALFSGAKEALVYDTLVDHKAEKTSEKVFGRFKISHLFGLMISAPLGSWIGQVLGVQWAMTLMVIPIALAGVTLTFVPEPQSSRELLRDDDTPSSHPPSWTAQKNIREQLHEAWVFFRGHPALGVMTFDMVTLWTLSFMIIWFHQIVLGTIGIDVQYFGVFITLSLVFQMLVLKIYPFLERLLGSKKRYLTLSGILPGIGFLCLALWPNVYTVILALLFCGGFGMTRRTLYVSHMNAYISSHNRATVNSFINIGIHMVSFFLKPGLGFLGDKSIPMALLILAGLCFVVSIFSRVEEQMLSGLHEGA